MNDRTGFMDLCHALKGGLFNLGLDEAAELAEKMELTAKKGESGPYREWFEQLRVQLTELIDFK